MTLRNLFNNSTARILDYILSTEEPKEFYLTQVSKATGLSYRTVLRMIPKLKKAGLIMETQRIGKISLYCYTDFLDTCNLRELSDAIKEPKRNKKRKLVE